VASHYAPVGILGGTFDPVHFGHLRLAEEVGDALKLSEVRFIPAGTPPHRANPGTSAEDRLEMVKLATADNERFRVDDREVKRSGRAYTVDTLTELRGELGPTRPLVLILGADAFLDLAAWNRWHMLFGLAHLAIAYRPGFPVDTWQSRMPQPLALEYAKRLMHQPLSIHRAPAGGIVVVPLTALDISATALREALRLTVSPRYLLPDSVLAYIRTRRLYT
jgi:nicotinate-nucleotide adenylyltransferase